MGYRSGTDREQLLMPETIDGYVEPDNAVRVIEACVEMLDMVKLGFKKAEPAAEGCPAYNPKDLMKLYTYGYMNRMRSSRQLERAARVNLELIWLMKGLQPDYRTIARFRQENATVMKRAFKATVQIFDKVGLYGKEGISIDGSKFKANNAPDKVYTKEQLQKREEELEARIQKYLSEMDKGDKEESAEGNRPGAEVIAKAIQLLRSRKEEVQRLIDSLEASGEKHISATDEESRLMKSRGDYIAGYNPQVATDTVSGMIAAYETTNHCNDMGMLSSVAGQAQETLNVKALQALADAGFDSPSDIAQALSMDVTPVVCSKDHDEFIDICMESDEDQQPEKQENGKCIYDAQRNLVFCPMGKALYPGYYNQHHKAGIYYNSKACKGCPCKCTKERYKKFMVRMKAHDFSKQYDGRDLKLKQIRIRYANAQEALMRRCTSEHGFGIIKESMGFRECLLRGIKNVDAEFALAFTSFNIKRAIAILGARELVIMLGSIGGYSFYLLFFGCDYRNFILPSCQN
jgi:transposase